MPIIRASASDYTKIVKAVAIVGAQKSNPAGSRIVSKNSAVVNVGAISSAIVGSSFKFMQPDRGVVVVASAAPAGITVSNAGGFDGVIIKYNSSGTPQWARRIGGSGGDYVRSVATDSNGNIVVVGQYFSNPVTIYDTDGTTAFTTLSNAGQADTFIIKYNSSGTPQWVRRIGGDGGDNGYGITTDSSGNITVGGTYSSNPPTIYDTDGTTTFTGFTALPYAGSIDGFIVQYNSSGTPQWARRIGGTEGDGGFAITTDSSGNITVGGNYTSTTLTIYDTDGTAAFTLANAGSTDAFIVQYDSSGDPQWARRIGGTGGDAAYDMTTDSSGNITVVGNYSSTTLTIYNTDGTTAFTTLSNAGSIDGFIIKYNSSGTPQSAKRIGGTGDDYASRIATDSNGNIVVVGPYTSTTMTIT